ncbi:MAG TPA: UrcA family protein [Gammaproteobacteria bacterium]
MNARLDASKLVFGFFAFAVLAIAPRYALTDAPPPRGPQIAVSYADLNMASASGVQALYRRIQRAGDRVCGPRPANADLRRFAAWNGCRDDAIAGAVGAVNHPMLTALHQGRSPAAVLAGASVPPK